MRKPDSIPTHPCMVPRHDLRRVHHPHDEHVVVTGGRVRRALARLVAAVHR